MPNEHSTFGTAHGPSLRAAAVSPGNPVLMRLGSSSTVAVHLTSLRTWLPDIAGASAGHIVT
ncbi:hypothetical protein IF2G_06509 [Cordyceps javanica]|nr:hypothetical protein IF2G_06509 [Cordyceps javanica]